MTETWYEVHVEYETFEIEQSVDNLDEVIEVAKKIKEQYMKDGIASVYKWTCEELEIDFEGKGK